MLFAVIMLVCLIDDPIALEAYSVLQNSGTLESSSYCSDRGIDPYAVGSRLNLIDPSMGFKWFEAHYSLGGDLNFLIGQGYSYFLQGRFDHALTIVKELKLKKMDPIHEARTYFLEGRALFGLFDFSAARTSFFNSFKSYKTVHGMLNGEFESLTYFCLSSVRSGDDAGIDEYLSLARSIGEEGVKQGKIINLALLDLVEGYHLYCKGVLAVDHVKSLTAGIDFFIESMGYYSEAQEKYLAEDEIEQAKYLLLRKALLLVLIGDYDSALSLVNPLSEEESPAIVAWVSIIKFKLLSCAGNTNESWKWKNVAIDWIVNESNSDAQDAWTTIKFLDRCGCLKPQPRLSK